VGTQIGIQKCAEHAVEAVDAVYVCEFNRGNLVLVDFRGVGIAGALRLIAVALMVRARLTLGGRICHATADPNEATKSGSLS
jgi:hypothetical protein